MRLMLMSKFLVAGPVALLPAIAFEVGVGKGEDLAACLCPGGDADLGAPVPGGVRPQTRRLSQASRQGL